MEASKIQDLRNDGGGQCLYLLHKETVNLGEIGRTKKTDVWELQLVRNSKQNLGRGSKLGEVTRFVYMGFSGPEFPVPDVKDVCLPPGASSAPPPPCREGAFHRGDVFPTFWRQRWIGVLFLHSLFLY